MLNFNKIRIIHSLDINQTIMKNKSINHLTDQVQKMKKNKILDTTHYSLRLILKIVNHNLSSENKQRASVKLIS